MLGSGCVPIHWEVRVLAGRLLSQCKSKNDLEMKLRLIASFVCTYAMMTCVLMW